jgi:hypothetical protein
LPATAISYKLLCAPILVTRLYAPVDGPRPESDLQVRRLALILGYPTMGKKYPG